MLITNQQIAGTVRGLDAKGGKKREIGNKKSERSDEQHFLTAIRHASSFTTDLNVPRNIGGWIARTATASAPSHQLIQRPLKSGPG